MGPKARIASPLCSSRNTIAALRSLTIQRAGERRVASPLFRRNQTILVWPDKRGRYMTLLNGCEGMPRIGLSSSVLLFQSNQTMNYTTKPFRSSASLFDGVTAWSIMCGFGSFSFRAVLTIISSLMLLGLMLYILAIIGVLFLKVPWIVATRSGWEPLHHIGKCLWTARVWPDTLRSIWARASAPMNRPAKGNSERSAILKTAGKRVSL